MVPLSIKVPVQSEVVLPDGALFVSIEPVIDFQKKKLGQDAQERDKETGKRLWVVTVTDLEQREPGKSFGASSEVKVKIASDYQPEVPPRQHPDFPVKVEFVGMRLTPWADSRKCMGRSQPHRCGARLGWSISAEAMVAFGTSGEAA